MTIIMRRIGGNFGDKTDMRKKRRRRRRRKSKIVSDLSRSIWLEFERVGENEIKIKKKPYEYIYAAACKKTIEIIRDR